MSAHVWSVLLAGGVGSRFWPASRAARPKQLLDLFGQGPMLRATLDRALPLTSTDRTIVVTSQTLAAEVRELLPEVPAEQVLAEPSGKNTAPAIAWAAKVALARDPEAVLMVLPADHHIADVTGFRQTVKRALALTDTHMVTIGVVPTHPETGYGYLRRGDPIGEFAHEVRAFVEKPSLENAARYLAGGEHLWNAGMFFMNARRFLDELETHRPFLGEKIRDAANVLDVWHELESISVDYAVMERSAHLAVVPGAFGWSDVGSWSALLAHTPGGADNFTSSTVDLIAIDAHRNVFYSQTRKVFAAIGVEGLIVADTGDALLIARADRDQDVKLVVDELKKSGARQSFKG